MLVLLPGDESCAGRSHFLRHSDSAQSRSLPRTHRRHFLCVQISMDEGKKWIEAAGQRDRQRDRQIDKQTQGQADRGDVLFAP